MLDNWNCTICKIYNDILNVSCISCKADKPDWLTTGYQYRVEIKRNIFIARIESYVYQLLESENMTEQEELFAKFYNEEKIFIKDMDVAQLREHRITLSKIAFEAKARLGAIDDDQRERNAKVKNKEFILTDVNNVPDSELINAPKLRQARMSKIDKMRQDLSKYLDEDTVNEMIRKMEKTATEPVVSSVKFTKVKSPVEVAVEKAKEDGTITDVVEAKPNPFSKFAPVHVGKNKMIGLEE